MGEPVKCAECDRDAAVYKNAMPLCGICFCNASRPPATFRDPASEELCRVLHVFTELKSVVARLGAHIESLKNGGRSKPD